MIRPRPIALLLFALAACSAKGDSVGAQSAYAAQTAADAPALTAARTDSVSASRQTAITRAVALVSPAVVTVQTEQVQQVQPDMFDWMFGGAPQSRSEAGLGTGVVIRPDGVIVTNAHVVAGARTISVMLPNGAVYPAKVLGTDETQRPGGDQDRRQEPARGQARQFRQPDRRRVGDRHRQSVRLHARQPASRASRSA